MFPRAMTSAKFNVTDSIENQSLPSIPTYKGWSKNCSGTTDIPRNKIGFDNKSNTSLTKHEVDNQQVREYRRIKKSYDDTALGENQSSFVHSVKNSYDAYSAISTENAMYSVTPRKLLEREPNSSGTKHCILLPTLLRNEADLLRLVAENDVESVEKFINDHPKININCTNYQGISALHIAVRIRCTALVEFLLQLPNVDIGDTVLHAVRDNSIKILAILLDHQKKHCPALEFTGCTHSTVFPAYITPLILAAQCCHYEIVVLLLNRGHTIMRPHILNCFCDSCKKSEINDDSVYANNARLSAYRAISSPVYLIHFTSDPILTAFQLTTELCSNAAADRQLEEAYLQLKDNVSAFAVDLMGYCRTSEEIELLLKQNTGSKVQRYFTLPRLLMAVDYKQRGFVAHPNTQQVLESYCLGDWHSWKRKSSISKCFTIFSRFFVIPFILLMCSVAPRHRLVRNWQTPLNKLITHAASYIVFLILVFLISNQDKSTSKRGPPDTGFESLLILYVCGYTWSAIRISLMQGPRRYFADMWNWAEIFMLSLFGLTFYFWIQSAIDAANNNDKNVERKYWNQYDPTLLAEGTFCLATIFAFFRLMYLCQLNYHLGPLQVSLGKMTIDIYKYGIVFAIILCAFAAGLTRLYQYYDGMVYEDKFGMKTVQVSSFTSLSDTLKTLFWALFCMAPLESADVVLENTRDPKNPDKYHENRHGFTECIGYFCFGYFEVILVIVVLNMLIATMSNTFQRVTDNVAIEWTFRRTEVYIQFMMQTTLPSPFNLIPTASGMGSVLEWCHSCIFKPKEKKARWSPNYCCYIERDMASQDFLEYPALMSILFQRYFSDKYDYKTKLNDFS